MATTSLKYFVRVPEGKGKKKSWVEYGPIEQDILIQWAKTGRVTRDSQIRNALLPTWVPADNVDFIKGIIIDPVAEAKRKQTWKDKFYAKLAREGEQKKLTVGGLHEAGRFKYDPAGPVERLFAWLIDIVLIGGLAALALLGSNFAIERLGVESNQVFALITVLAIFGYIWYFTVRIAFRAQTIGQWFWGIMLVRSDGEPVLAARALSFTFWHFFFAWLTVPCTIVMPGGRAVHDFLSGTRVVSIKVRQDT